MPRSPAPITSAPPVAGTNEWDATNDQDVGGWRKLTGGQCDLNTGRCSGQDDFGEQPGMAWHQSRSRWRQT